MNEKYPSFNFANSIIELIVEMETVRKFGGSVGEKMMDIFNANNDDPLIRNLIQTLSFKKDCFNDVVTLHDL